jgi:hypothetical protein
MWHKDFSDMGPPLKQTSTVTFDISYIQGSVFAPLLLFLVPTGVDL